MQMVQTIKLGALWSDLAKKKKKQKSNIERLLLWAGSIGNMQEVNLTYLWTSAAWRTAL